MSIIKQVRDMIADFDGRQFTISDFSAMWEGHPDSKRIYKAVGTCLNKLKIHHMEIKAIGKEDESKLNRKRSVIYQACDIAESGKAKTAFINHCDGFYYNMKLNDIFISV